MTMCCRTDRPSVYYQEQVDAVNPLESDSDLTLPGWDSSYTREELKSVVAEYHAMSEDTLWNNLKYFLERIDSGGCRVRCEYGNS